MLAGKGYPLTKAGPEVLTIGVSRDRGKFSGVGGEKVSVAIQRDERGQFATQGHPRVPLTDRSMEPIRNSYNSREIGADGSLFDRESAVRAWWDDLMNADRNAFRSYQGADSQRVRHIEATGERIPGDWVPEVVDRMNAAMDRAPHYQGKVWRGLQGLNEEDLEVFLHSEDLFTAKATTSFSKEQAIAARFTRQGGQGSLLIEMECARGVELMPGREMEQEVLLRKGSQWERIGEPQKVEVKGMYAPIWSVKYREVVATGPAS